MNVTGVPRRSMVLASTSCSVDPDCRVRTVALCDKSVTPTWAAVEHLQARMSGHGAKELLVDLAGVRLRIDARLGHSGHTFIRTGLSRRQTAAGDNARVQSLLALTARLCQ